ncbi:hypothetical protein RRG08_005928 [Elysia crispata]|uniref:Uncharacterized protein n=1 Tax=Elysia crispata TaxID=231223 RepID=A0AAE0Z9Q3_9GAST|nr:hypothetical protein RRG08_005928 [Elysia crispata]
MSQCPLLNCDSYGSMSPVRACILRNNVPSRHLQADVSQTAEPSRTEQEAEVPCPGAGSSHARQSQNVTCIRNLSRYHHMTPKFWWKPHLTSLARDGVFRVSHVQDQNAPHINPYGVSFHNHKNIHRNRDQTDPAFASVHCNPTQREAPPSRAGLTETRWVITPSKLGLTETREDN